jgi:type I restriction enzyme S subunit
MYVVFDLKREFIEPEFLMHFFRSSFGKRQIEGSTESGARFRLPYENLSKMNIQLPPISVQQEIVSILDKFKELEAELEHELEARIGQYQIVKSELLKSKSHWVLTTLGELGRVSTCKRVFKGQTSATGEIPFFKIGTFGKEPDSFIDSKLFEEYRSKYSYPRIGDILLSASGTIGRRVVFDGKDSYFQDSNIIWLEHDESKILNRFLYHWYLTVDWKTQGGTISRLYNSNLLSTQVCLPPLEEQIAISETLDSFEVFIADTSTGLPAELGRRRQQYEYYRNKLLTFKELKSS